MNANVARLAQRHAVFNVIAQFWKLGPTLNVVRVHSAAVMFAALAAGVLVAPPNGLHPSQVCSGTALVLVGLAALPVPMVAAGQFQVASAAKWLGPARDVLGRLAPPSQARPQYPSLSLAELGQLLGSQSARPQLMAVDEATVCALDHSAAITGVCDYRRHAAASALAVHPNYFTAGRAA